MSFNIDWNHFSTDFAEELRVKANNMIKEIETPSILKNLKIDKLHLGSTAPQIEISDITTPEMPSIILTETSPETTESTPTSPQKSERSVRSHFSTVSSRAHYFKRKQSPTLFVQAILQGNTFLPESKRINVKPPVFTKRVFPPAHIHSSLKSNPIKKVMTSNLDDDDDLSEKDLFESLNYRGDLQPKKESSATDMFGDGMLMKLNFQYDGNATITFSANVSIDIPTVENFVTFPIVITVSHLVIEGDLVVEMKGKQVKVYLEKDIHGPLKDFAFSVQFGDEYDEILVDKHQIGAMLKNCIRFIVEKNIMFPNFHSIDIEKYL